MGFMDYMARLCSTSDHPHVIPQKVPLSAIGVIQVTIQSAHINKSRRNIFKRSPDPFVAIRIGDHGKIAHTSHERHTYDPNWIAQTHFALVYSLSDTLRLMVFDRHDHLSHKLLGTASFDLSVLRIDAGQSGLRRTVLKDQQEFGDVLFDVSYHPIVPPTDGREANTGIVRLNISAARGLVALECAPDELKPLAEVSLGWTHSPIHITQRCPFTGDPTWNSVYEFLCLDKGSTDIVVKVLDDRLKEPSLGHLTIPLSELVESHKAETIWRALSGSRNGEMTMNAEWKPLRMDSHKSQ